MWLEKALVLVPKFPKSLPWIAVLTSIRSVGVLRGDTAELLQLRVPSSYLCALGLSAGSAGGSEGCLVNP